MFPLYLPLFLAIIVKIYNRFYISLPKEDMMATYINEPSHTFNEYLLIPGYSSCECIPANVSLKTPLVKFKKERSLLLSWRFPWCPPSCRRFPVRGWR